MPTILILGATSDMGTAIARLFAEKKFDVQLASRNPSKLESLQTDLRIRFGINSSTHPFDATDFNTHQSFYDALIPSPDITACVFGYMNENEDVINDQAETLKTIHTNYTGAVSILNIVAKDYAGKKKGCIAGISSVAGERGRQSNYIYGSAKAGFTTYLSGLRNRLYANGVHVITVLPGFVYTKMTAHLHLPKLLTATPDEVAQAIFHAVQKRKNTIYVKWFWRWIMCLIKSIPEGFFKRMKL